MAHVTSGNGKMAKDMVRDWQPQKTVTSFRANFSKIRNMGSVS